ncbi:MAG: hypothetical protein ACE5OQ_07565 [Woeseia sp.]
MAFAGVLAGAAVVTGFAATLALALVHALAHMLLAAFGCLVLSNNMATLRAGKNSGYSAEQQFIEISSFHTHPGILHKSTTRHVHPTHVHGTHPATKYTAIISSRQTVPNHRGLAVKLTPHGKLHGAVPANASAYA